MCDQKVSRLTIRLKPHLKQIIICYTHWSVLGLRQKSFAHYSNYIFTAFLSVWNHLPQLPWCKTSLPLPVSSSFLPNTWWNLRRHTSNLQKVYQEDCITWVQFIRNIRGRPQAFPRKEAQSFRNDKASLIIFAIMKEFCISTMIHQDSESKNASIISATGLQYHIFLFVWSQFLVIYFLSVLLHSLSMEIY